MEVIEKKVKSLGEELFPINETDSPEVTRVNELCAELVEILKKNYSENPRTPIKSLIFDHSIGEVINANSSIIKVLKQ